MKNEENVFESYLPSKGLGFNLSNNFERNKSCETIADSEIG